MLPAFEWDQDKADRNVRKHKIGSEQAIAVFRDEHHVVIDASRDVDGESRSKAVGLISGRLFTIVFVMPGENCRLISARRANSTEERAYGHCSV